MLWRLYRHSGCSSYVWGTYDTFEEAMREMEREVTRQVSEGAKIWKSSSHEVTVADIYVKPEYRSTFEVREYYPEYEF